VGGWGGEGKGAELSLYLEYHVPGKNGHEGFFRAKAHLQSLIKEKMAKYRDENKVVRGRVHRLALPFSSPSQEGREEYGDITRMLRTLSGRLLCRPD